MCWSEQLYDAMIHVYNSGMHDYTTPLTELLLQLRGTLKKGKPISGEPLGVSGASVGGGAACVYGNDRGNSEV